MAGRRLVTHVRKSLLRVFDTLAGPPFVEPEHQRASACFAIEDVLTGECSGWFTLLLLLPVQTQDGAGFLLPQR
jgi:hypothetical protein